MQHHKTSSSVFLLATLSVVYTFLVHVHKDGSGCGRVFKAGINNTGHLQLGREYLRVVTI